MSFSAKSLSHITLVIVVAAASAMADEPDQQRQPIRVTIDADILAAFVDEPCHHFEQARDSLRNGDGRTAAKELRIGAAFLKLEAARSTPQGRKMLTTSIQELERLAVSSARNQVKSVKVFEQAFARAHFALAGHHCINSAHRCCRPTTFKNKREMKKAGHDLKAATVHLKRGSIWGGGDLDEETQKIFDEAQRSARELIENKQASQSRVTRSIHSVHRRLESLTGSKISIVPPRTAIDDKLGPRIFE